MNVTPGQTLPLLPSRQAGWPPSSGWPRWRPPRTRAPFLAAQIEVGLASSAFTPSPNPSSRQNKNTAQTKPNPGARDINWLRPQESHPHVISSANFSPTLQGRVRTKTSCLFMKENNSISKIYLSRNASKYSKLSPWIWTWEGSKFVNCPFYSEPNMECGPDL